MNTIYIGSEPIYIIPETNSPFPKAIYPSPMNIHIAPKRIYIVPEANRSFPKATYLTTMNIAIAYGTINIALGVNSAFPKAVYTNTVNSNTMDTPKMLLVWQKKLDDAFRSAFQA